VGPRYPDEKLGFIPSDMTPVAVLQTIIVFVSTKRSQYVEPNSAYTSLRVLYRVPHVNCQLCACVVRYDEADYHVVIRSVQNCGVLEINACAQRSTKLVLTLFMGFS